MVVMITIMPVLGQELFSGRLIMNIETRNTLVEMIEKHEGTGKMSRDKTRFLAYKCPAGKTTVGYGRNLDDRGLSEEEVLYLLINDITEIESQIISATASDDKKLVSAKMLKEAYEGLDDTRKMVLIDMAYNMGYNGLRSFKNTIASILARDYEEAANRMLKSAWASQVGNRAKELALIMRTGAM